jgi:hypothetical protein
MRVSNGKERELAWSALRVLDAACPEQIDDGSPVEQRALAEVPSVVTASQRVVHASPAFDTEIEPGIAGAVWVERVVEIEGALLRKIVDDLLNGLALHDARYGHRIG